MLQTVSTLCRLVALTCLSAVKAGEVKVRTCPPKAELICVCVHMWSWKHKFIWSGSEQLEATSAIGFFSPYLSGVPLSQCVLPLRSSLSCLTFAIHFLYLFVFVWLLFKASPIVYVHVWFCSHCLLIFLIVGGFLCILPKYSQKALADFPPDGPLFVHCHSEWWEGSRLFSPNCCRDCKEEQHICRIWGCERALCYLSGKVYPSP